MAMIDQPPVAAGVETVDDGSVLVIDDMSAFLDAVDNSKDGRLVVIKCYVPWCKACRQFDMKFRELAVQQRDLERDVQFYELNLHQAREVKKMLDIKVAPSVLMYRGEVLAERFNCGPRKFDDVKNKVAKYIG